MGAGNGEGSIFADSGRMRLEQGGTTLYPICEINNWWNDAEDAANARLIAAAPELLAALQSVADYWAGGDVPADIDAAMRAAITKATGV
jgi:hypothetical protein